MNLYIAFFFNILINSLLMFFTVCLLIETFLFLFRIKNIRLRLFARVIPLCKLALDLFFYRYHSWALFNSVNPLEAEEGTRALNLSFDLTTFPLGNIFFSVNKLYNFTLGDVLYLKSNGFITLILISVILGISFYRIIWQFLKKEKNLVSKPFSPLISNEILRDKCKKYKVSFQLSEGSHSPFVKGIKKPVIFFDKFSLEAFSQKELEAVIAHELAHVVNKDLYLLSLFQFINAFFWWVPKKWLLTKIFRDQEFLADKKATSWNIKPIDLASAIFHSVKGLNNANTYPFKSNYSQYRIKQILFSKNKKTIFRSLIFLYLVVGILFGNIWLF